MSAHQILRPEGWPPAKGYADGILATGRTLWLAGQIGRDQSGKFGPDLPSQLKLALANVLGVLESAGGRAEHIVRLTWYVVSIADYSRQLKEVGLAYRSVMGRNFPAMSVVEIARLVEPEAMIEIEATAVLPDRNGDA